jgi:triosephosphate isomerase
MSVMPPVVVAANWKMHKDPDETRAFFRAFRVPEDTPRPGVLVFPPAVSLAAALATRPEGVSLGVQNIHWEDRGAFTGEISAPLARAAGASHTLIGHSERRHLFGESDDDVAKKVAAALRHDLVPLVCLGETLAERRAGRVDDVIVRQLDAALTELAAAGAGFLLAYEPVWAIGTGETATPADAEAAHGTLRARLTDRLGGAASGIPILYGGSVKPDNARDLMAARDVDGVLVGGASLDAAQFAAIVEAAPAR